MFGFFKKISKPKDIEEITPEDVEIKPEEININLSQVEVECTSFNDIYMSNIRTRVLDEVNKSIQEILISGPKYHQTKSLMESDQISKHNVDSKTNEKIIERFPGAVISIIDTDLGYNKLVSNIDDPDYLLEILARKQVEEFYSDK